MTEQETLNAAWERVNEIWHRPGVAPDVAASLQSVLVALAPYRNVNQHRRETRTVFQWREFYESECLRMAQMLES